MKDLFQSPELLPNEVRAIVEKYNLLHEQIPDNEICINMLAELKPLGYTFDYGLDYEPTNLRKVEELYSSNVLINKVELASVLAHTRALDELLHETNEIDSEEEMYVLDQDSEENGSGESYVYSGVAQEAFDRWYNDYLTTIEELEIK